jgi:hypothetical protein
LAIGDKAIVLALKIVVIPVNGAVSVGGRRNENDARIETRGTADDEGGQKKSGESIVGKMVDSELELEPFGRSTFRDCHDSWSLG